MHVKRTQGDQAQTREGSRSRRGRRRGGRGGGGSTIDSGSKTILETLPDEVSLTIPEDQAIFIRISTQQLALNCGVGSGFGSGNSVLFLKNFRATAIIGAAIPMSIVVTFIPMYLYDVSLNLMSLGGLALGIGMLVDNAVVALENIQECIWTKDPIEKEQRPRKEYEKS